MKIKTFSDGFTVSRLTGAGARPYLSVISGALLCLLLSVQTADARAVQWVWKNAQGVKVYSDMPPPAHIPKKNVLKSPHREVVKRQARASTGPVGLVDAKVARGETDAATANAPDATAGADGSQTKGVPTKGAESALDRKVAEKRKKAEAEKKAKAEKEKAEQEKQENERLAKQEENCRRIAESRRNLTSGSRVTTTDEKGERKFLSEQDIQNRLDRLDAAAQSNEC